MVRLQSDIVLYCPLAHDALNDHKTFFFIHDYSSAISSRLIEELFFFILSSVSVYEKQVPMLIKDPLSLFIQFVLTMSFTIEAGNNTSSLDLP